VKYTVCVSLECLLFGVLCLCSELDLATTVDAVSYVYLHIIYIGLHTVIDTVPQPPVYSQRHSATSFRVTIARAWNSLPTNVTASTFMPSFKRQNIFIYQIFPISLIASCNLCTVSWKLLYLADATLISTF